MRILLVGSFEHPMYAPAFESGFSALGHDVEVVKYEDYLYGFGGIGVLLTKIQNRLHIGLKLKHYNKEILMKVQKNKPDFVFLYRCYNIWPKTIEKIKHLNCCVITYNNDDPFSGTPDLGFYRFFQRILKLADINYVYRKKNIADYESVGAKNVKVLLPYYIGKNNYREECEDTIPIAFLGHFENDGRDSYIKALIEAGVPVTVFNGSDWEAAPLYEDIKLCIKPGKRGKDYNHTINECQIAIVFLSKLNNDTYTRRCFEIPATQTLMLSEYTDDLNAMFPADECAVYFRNPDELVKKCKHLLENPLEIKRIARNGYSRLMELGGSEVDRCNQIIETYKHIFYDRKTKN